MTQLTIAIVDIVAWPVLQLAISAAVVRIPARLFSRDNALTRIRGFEQPLRIYRIVRVPAWKKLLPDGASWVGGQAKRVSPFDTRDVRRFLAETRRGEIAHWIQLLCAVFFWGWNPLWAALVMTGYAILSNVPCILVQRYNRAVLLQRAPAA